MKRNTEKETYQPTFLRNLGFLWKFANWEERVYLVVAFAPISQGWLDSSTVVGNSNNERAAAKLMYMIRRVADFSKIQPPYSGLDAVRNLQLRLSGLIKSIQTEN